MIDITKYNTFKTYTDYMDFASIIKDFKDHIHNINYVYDITKYKTYYCNKLTIPKDRIKGLESKYGLKRVRDINKADVVFSDFYNIDSVLNDKLKIPLLYIIKASNGNIHNLRNFTYTMLYANMYINSKSDDKFIEDLQIRVDNVKKSLPNHTNIESHYGYYIKRYVEDFVNFINPYLSNKPVLCITDLVEEDKDILYISDFVNKYKHRLLSSNSANITLLSIYAKYNIYSFKIVLNRYSALYSEDFINKRKVEFLHTQYKNTDVYTKYLFSNLKNIKTANNDLKRIYKFSSFAKNNRNKEIDSIYSNYNLKLNNMVDKETHMNQLNPLHFSFISNYASLRHLESNLINFNILPEKEKHEIINIMLDLISNIQVDNTKYFTKDDL